MPPFFCLYYTLPPSLQHACCIRLFLSQAVELVIGSSCLLLIRLTADDVFLTAIRSGVPLSSSHPGSFDLGVHVCHGCFSHCSASSSLWHISPLFVLFCVALLAARGPHGILLSDSPIFVLGFPVPFGLGSSCHVLP